MKTLLKISIFVLFISFLTISCKKDENLTDLDKIELELKTFTSNKNITKCTIREYQNNVYEEVVKESAFSFSNGFIVVNRVYPTITLEYRYNLLNLYDYGVADNNVLFLEFVKN